MLPAEKGRDEKNEIGTVLSRLSAYTAILFIAGHGEHAFTVDECSMSNRHKGEVPEKTFSGSLRHRNRKLGTAISMCDHMQPHSTVLLRDRSRHKSGRNTLRVRLRASLPMYPAALTSSPQLRGGARQPPDSSSGASSWEDPPKLPALTDC